MFNHLFFRNKVTLPSVRISFANQINSDAICIIENHIVLFCGLVKDVERAENNYFLSYLLKIPSLGSSACKNDKLRERENLWERKSLEKLREKALFLDWRGWFWGRVYRFHNLSSAFKKIKKFIKIIPINLMWTTPLKSFSHSHLSLLLNLFSLSHTLSLSLFLALRIILHEKYSFQASEQSWVEEIGCAKLKSKQKKEIWKKIFFCEIVN